MMKMKIYFYKYTSTQIKVINQRSYIIYHLYILYMNINKCSTWQTKKRERSKQTDIKKNYYYDQ